MTGERKKMCMKPRHINTSVNYVISRVPTPLFKEIWIQISGKEISQFHIRSLISLWIIPSTMCVCKPALSPCDQHVLLWAVQAAVAQHSLGPLSLSDNCCSLVGEEEVPKRTNKSKLADANLRLSESTQSMVSIGLRNNRWLKSRSCFFKGHKKWSIH